MRTAPFVFESKACPRCGGTGHYSRCEMYGTTCFKCSGQKQLLTARGRKAYEAYRAFKASVVGVRADQLKAGDRVWQDACFYGTYRAGWQTVLGTAVDEANRALGNTGAYSVRLEKVTNGCAEDSIFLRPATPAEVATMDAWLEARLGKGVLRNPKAEEVSK